MCLHSDDSILPNHTIEFVGKFPFCFSKKKSIDQLLTLSSAAECGKPNGYTGIKKMTELKDRVHAFIGPDESCASEALVAAAWNIPIVSYVCKSFNEN